MLMIRNQGQALLATNYWDSPSAQSGHVYLTWNAGAGRLLVPDSAQDLLAETQNASEVIVSRGSWTAMGGREALELLWEDGSDYPFALHLVKEQTDRLLPDTQQGGGLVIAIWTRAGLFASWPGRYRRVAALPCLQAWERH